MDDASKMAVKGEMPTVSISERSPLTKAKLKSYTVTTVNRERSGLQPCLSHCHRANGQTATRPLPGR